METSVVAVRTRVYLRQPSRQPRVRRDETESLRSEIRDLVSSATDSELSDRRISDFILNWRLQCNKEPGNNHQLRKEHQSLRRRFGCRKSSMASSRWSKSKSTTKVLLAGDQTTSTPCSIIVRLASMVHSK